MLQRQELEAGLTPGAARDDYSLVGSDAPADEQSPQVFDRLEFVGVTLRCIRIIGLGQQLPRDVAGSRDVAVTNEGLVGALELGLGPRIDDHHVLPAHQR